MRQPCMLQVRIINAIWTHKFQHLYSQPSGIKHFCKWKLVNKCIFRIATHMLAFTWASLMLVFETQPHTNSFLVLQNQNANTYSLWFVIVVRNAILQLITAPILWGIYFRNENPANTHFYAINFPHFWPTNIILKSIKFSSWHLCRGLSRTLIFSYSLQ